LDNNNIKTPERLKYHTGLFGNDQLTILRKGYGKLIANNAPEEVLESLENEIQKVKEERIQCQKKMKESKTEKTPQLHPHQKMLVDQQCPT